MQWFYNVSINSEHHLIFIYSKVTAVTVVALNHLIYVNKETTAENHRNFQEAQRTRPLQIPAFLCLSSVPLPMTVFIVCSHMLRKLGRYKSTWINEPKINSNNKKTRTLLESSAFYSHISFCSLPLTLLKYLSTRHCFYFIVQQSLLLKKWIAFAKSPF